MKNWLNYKFKWDSNLTLAKIYGVSDMPVTIQITTWISKQFKNISLAKR